MRKAPEVVPEFGKLVIAGRVVHNLSQVELAKAVGCSQPHIARLELGRVDPALSLVAKLMNVIGLDCCVLFKTQKERGARVR